MNPVFKVIYMRELRPFMLSSVVGTSSGGVRIWLNNTSVTLSKLERDQYEIFIERYSI